MAIDFSVDDKNTGVAPSYVDWPNYEWHTQNALSTQVKKVSTRVHGGTAIKYVVNPGDQFGGSTGERAEGAWYASDEHLFEGATKWYAWSSYFPTQEQPTNWRIFTQWHADDQFTQAPIKMESVDGGVSRLTVKFNTGEEAAGGSAWELNQRFQITPNLVFDSWYDFMVGVKWSHTATGSFRVYYRNRSIDAPLALLRIDNIPTMVWAQTKGIGTMYLKQGLYRNSGVSTLGNSYVSSVIHDYVRRGDSRDDVASAFFRQSIRRDNVDVSRVSL